MVVDGHSDWCAYAILRLVTKKTMRLRAGFVVVRILFFKKKTRDGAQVSAGFERAKSLRLHARRVLHILFFIFLVILF